MPVERVDEVSTYYQPVAKIERAKIALFWVVAVLSLLILQAGPLFQWGGQEFGRVAFIVLGLTFFMLAMANRFYFIPRAERMRRRQLLSDSFGTSLSHDRTILYYNNEFSPSLERLAASTMENALFSKEIAGEMLGTKRLVIGGYLLLWLVAFTLRHDDLNLLIWITQVVFSAELVAGWISLEVLRTRHEATYEELHHHFLHGIGDRSGSAIAAVLEAFASYEVTKAATGVQLSPKVFARLNPDLTAKWESIQRDLGMGDDPEDLPETEV